jgi:hypothetical protein
MDQEAQGMAVAVKKEDRQKLTADALIKLQKTVTEGMTLKFSLTSHHSDDQLVDCYNLALRIDTLKNRLKETDTIGGLISLRRLSCNLLRRCLQRSA